MRVEKRPERVSVLTISVVTHDGVTAPHQVHADLVPPARHRRHLHLAHGHALELTLQGQHTPLQHPEPGLARLAVVLVDPFLETFRILRVASHRRVHRPLVLLRVTEHDRQVGLLRLSFPEQLGGGPRGSFVGRGYQHPRRGVVQLMHEPNRVPVRVPCLQPVLHAQVPGVLWRESCLTRPAPRGVQTHAPRLVHHRVVVVLVHQGEVPLERLRLPGDGARDALPVEPVVVVQEP